MIANYSYPPPKKKRKGLAVDRVFEITEITLLAYKL